MREVPLAERRSKVKAVSFDVTGTLIFPRDVAATYARVLSRHGVPAQEAAIERLLPEVWKELACSARPDRDRFAAHPEGAPGFWRDLVVRLCSLADLPSPPTFAHAELFETFARAEAWRLAKGVPEILDRIAARGLKLAVVSNWDERLPRLLDRLGLAARFDAVVYSQEVGVEKPHPAIFRAALERLGVRAEETVHVGDRKLEDVEGARGAGLETLGLAPAGDLARLADLTGRIEKLA